MAEVAEITGFRAKRRVPSETISKEGWSAWLKDEIDRKVKPHEIRAQEGALKMFGLVPRDFDLKQSTVDLYTEQAAAFYDTRRKRMTFVEGFLDEPLQMTLPHELAHALADQQYNLERFLDKAAKNDDAQLARLSVVEGQATWVMIEVQGRKAGQSLFQNSRQVVQFAESIAASTGMISPALQNSPLYIRRTMLFPYAQGLLFQAAVIERMGKSGFDEVLRRPPETTQEILHPERYLQRIRPAKPDLPALPKVRAYRQILDGSFGEIDVQLLLEQFSLKDAAGRLPPRWRGGQYQLLEARKGGALLLRWAIAFDSPSDAREYVQAYSEILPRKATEVSYAVRNQDQLIGINDAGGFRISARQARVEGIEGLPGRPGATNRGPQDQTANRPHRPQGALRGALY